MREDELEELANVPLRDQLAAIAPVLNRLEALSDATVCYDLFADALIWSDELPPFDEIEPPRVWCLRPVFHFRTRLILAQASDLYREYWLDAHRLFPSWPGLHSERCKPNDELAAEFRRWRAKAWRSLDKADRYLSALCLRPPDQPEAR